MSYIWYMFKLKQWFNKCIYMIIQFRKVKTVANLIKIILKSIFFNLMIISETSTLDCKVSLN